MGFVILFEVFFNAFFYYYKCEERKNIKYLNFLIFYTLQHFIFATDHLIDFLVPDIPEELDVAIKREAYRAKKALSDNPSLNENSEDELDDKNIDLRTVH